MLNTELKIKPLDILIFVFGISAILFSFKILGKGKGSEKYLVVAAYESEYIYPLNKDASLEFEGIEGISKIEIKDGKAFFTDSCCPNKTCVQCTPICNNNEWTACLPNQVFIRVEGGSSEDDVVAR